MMMRDEDTGILETYYYEKVTIPHAATDELVISWGALSEYVFLNLRTMPDIQKCTHALTK